MYKIIIVMLLSYKSSLSYYLEFSTILSASKAVIPEPKINSFINLSFVILSCIMFNDKQYSSLAPYLRQLWTTIDKKNE